MEQQAKNYKIPDIALPVLLLLWALVGINQGVDLSDSSYSLTNYLFFRELEGSWLYATFLANAAGYLLVMLTGGKVLLMNAVGAGIIAITAIIVYYGMKEYIPRSILFLGEVIAIGLCWCPRVILYNYLTYLLLAAASIILYKAVLNEKKWLFFGAGILLGLNVFVRASNLTEAALIVVVWYGAFINKKSLDENAQFSVLKQTGLCIAGYLAGLLAGMVLMILTCGIDGYTEMLNWMYSLLTSGDDAGGYSIGEMIGTIIENYVGNLRWFALMLLGTLMGTVMFSVKKESFLIIKRILYMMGIVLLAVYFYRNGVFTTQYYKTGSIYCFSVLFFIIEFILLGILLFHKQGTREDKLLALLTVLILLITPIGSNNHLYTCINNMFLLAPVGLYAGYRIYGFYHEKSWLFPCSTMCAALAAGLLIQSAIFHSCFVFRDGEDGIPRDTVVAENGHYDYYAGMRTGREHADAMEGLIEYVGAHFNGEEKLILYGNIPGVSYLLQMPTAVTTSWPDLDSFSAEKFAEELEALNADLKVPADIGHDNENGKWPVVILSPEIAAVVTEDAEGMALLGVDMESYRENEKIAALSEYILSNGYGETYSNTEFVVFEK